MTQDAPSIKVAILAKLAAAVDLSMIKKWLKAEPVPTRYPTSPFGWVEYNGGPRRSILKSGSAGKSIGEIILH